METVLLYILGILIVGVGIIVSIALHEVGHLVPAKLFGVRVGQYMIGFGKTLFSFRRGETEYGIKAFPGGGYISMAGMYPPIRGKAARSASTGFFQTLVQDARTASAETIPEGSEDRVFYKLPVWKRIIIMLGGPFMNLVIAVVLFAIVMTGFGVQQFHIGTVAECVQPASSTSTTCAADDPAAPGATAGLKPGDRIVSIDGTTISTWDQVTAIAQKSAGKALTVDITRAGVAKTLTITPLLTERDVYTAAGKPVKNADGTTKTQKVGFIGISPAYALEKQPLSAVLPAVGTNIASVAGIIVNLPQRLVAVGQAAFGSGERDANGPIGIVGVGRIAGEITSATTVSVTDRVAFLIQLVASLNVALFVFNLVPLMPLDGGHIAGALIEGVRRTWAKIFKRRDPGPIDTARAVPLTLAVVVVLGAMSLLLAYADIVKPITLQ